MSSAGVMRRCRPHWTISLLLLLVQHQTIVGSMKCCNENGGLAATIARALNRIRESTRDYRLMDDLWFETLPDSGPRPSSPPPPPPPTFDNKSQHRADLVRLADAVFDTHRLSWRNAIVDGTDLIVYKDRTLQRYAFDFVRQDGTANGKSPGGTGIRTFGVHRRRMQMMLPIMYKLGVITTLLFGLTVLSVKGVTIGLILLMLAVTGIVTKVSTRQSQHHYAPPWSAAIHDVYDRSSSSPQSQQPYAAQHEKSIHVHVHAALPGATVVRDADDVGDGAQHYWNGAVGDYRRRYYGDDGAHYYRGPGSDAVAFDTSSTNSAYRRWLG